MKKPMTLERMKNKVGLFSPKPSRYSHAFGGKVLTVSAHWSSSRPYMWRINGKRVGAIKARKLVEKANVRASPAV